jgi:hypothetical protein
MLRGRGDFGMTLAPELDAVQQLAATVPAAIRVQVVETIECAGQRLPLHVFTLGNPSRSAAAVGVFGGVHGLERIGAQLAIAFLRTLVHRLSWDPALQALLERLHIVVLPLVNPGGLWQRTRANPQGVDLMRNAPIDAEATVTPALGGQRFSPWLPWYRGPAGAPMEAESAALCTTVEQTLGMHGFAVSVDCHSGFGLRDRLWFPYACTPRPIEHLPEMLALAELMDASLMHHRYLMEPQSLAYLTHGDLWDHLYRRSLARGDGVLLPLTLEMGSWVWVRKNPRQLFTRLGLFNPLIEHRHQRVLRRHLQLLDFVLRAAAGHDRWLPAAADRPQAQQRGLARWYSSLRQAGP